VPDMLITTPSSGPLSANQVPARLRVAAVTRPGWWYTGEAALVTGLLCGPFGVRLQQMTTGLPQAVWPAQGQELPAVADAANPAHFEVVWSSATYAAAAGQAQWRREGEWDPGPGGSHQQAVVEYLASIGCQPSDFPGLDRTWPAMLAQLAEACSRYFTVIPGQEAVSLMSTGTPAQGTVAEVQRLPLPPEFTSQRGIMAWLTLEVTPPGGPPYRTTIRFGFRSAERFAALATPGTRLPLRVDAASPAKVTIDLPALGITPA
jgi:hypothetical protein